MGALVAHLMPAEVLRVIMPVVLVAVALFFAFKPGLSDADRVERIGARLIKPLLVVTSAGMALKLLWQAFG